VRALQRLVDRAALVSALVHAPVIVTGTGRSGTSTVARLLHEECGVAMAPSRELLAPAGPANPEGVYEDLEVRQLHIDVKRGVLTLAEFRLEMMRLASVRAAKPWGWKDPRGSHVLGLHLQWFPGATIIWCQRSLPDVVRSIHRWYHTREPEAARETTDRWAQLHALLHHRLNVYPIRFDQHLPDAELAHELRAIVAPAPRTGPAIPAGPSSRVAPKVTSEIGTRAASGG